MIIQLAKSDTEITDNYPAILELRPHLSEEEFPPRVRYQEAVGYQLAFIREAKGVIAVAGFRTGDNLAW